MRVRVGDVRLYFDVAGMELVPDGPMMRERPIVVCLHGGPGFDHSTLKPFLGPLENEAQLISSTTVAKGAATRARLVAGTSIRGSTTWLRFAMCSESRDRSSLGSRSAGSSASGSQSDTRSCLRGWSSPAALRSFGRSGGWRCSRSWAVRRLGTWRRGSSATPIRRASTRSWSPAFPFYGRAPRDPDVRARVRLRPEVNFHFFGGELQTYNWFDDLNRIRCPTLILAGEVDPMATVLDHEELAAAIAGSRLEVFPDAGHGVFRDKPDEALAIIRDFIRASREPATAADP